MWLSRRVQTCHQHDQVLLRPHSQTDQTSRTSQIDQISQTRQIDRGPKTKRAFYRIFLKKNISRVSMKCTTSLSSKCRKSSSYRWEAPFETEPMAFSCFFTIELLCSLPSP